eukprot:jgi/Botrbrau1/12126/Bobra.0186s0043.1
MAWARFSAVLITRKSPQHEATVNTSKSYRFSSLSNYCLVCMLWWASIEKSLGNPAKVSTQKRGSCADF